MTHQSKIIAIIDDGINKHAFNTGELCFDIEITPTNVIHERSAYDTFSISHGTICAAIIKKYAPNVRIGSIKVLDENGFGTKKQLVSALEWCIEHGIALVSMSIGTTNFMDYDDIRSVINKAYCHRMVIVAACSNKSIVTYPAFFHNVLGVNCDMCKFLKEGQYMYNEITGYGNNITAYGVSNLVKYDGETLSLHKCNSFASPIVTSAVYNIIQEDNDYSFESVKASLIKKAVNYNKLYEYSSITLCNKIDWIDKALIVNIGDNSSVSSDVCFFDIVDILKIPNECVNNIIKNIARFMECNKYSIANSIIINVSANVITSENDEKILIEAITKKGVNTIYLNDNYYCKTLGELRSNSFIKLWHPLIAETAIVRMKCKSIDIPVIVVYSSTVYSLVKILHYLNIRFRTEGYHSIIATNKCIGILSGLEYIPIYNSVDKGLSLKESIEAIYSIYDCDLIIYGIDIKERGHIHIDEIDKMLMPDIRIMLVDNKYDIYIDYNLFTYNADILCAYLSKGDFLIENAEQFYNKLSNLFMQIFDLLCRKNL